MEECALCGKRARMVCESDEAVLCWECDGKVHGANFLVANHLRILLCRLCQSPTPWKASGPTLTPTAPLCHRCLPINHHHNHYELHSSNDGPEEDEEEEEGIRSSRRYIRNSCTGPHRSSRRYTRDSCTGPHGSSSRSYTGGSNSSTGTITSKITCRRIATSCIEGETQVVPWSSSSASPLTLVSSINSETDRAVSSAAGGARLPLKRFRDNSVDDSDDEIECSLSSEALPNDESSSMSTFRPLKQPRINHGGKEAA